MKLCFDKNVTWKQQLLHFIHSMLQLLKCGIQTFSLWTGITGLTPFGHFWITLKKENCQSLGLAVDLERQMLDCHAAVSQYLNLKFE